VFDSFLKLFDGSGEGQVSSSKTFCSSLWKRTPPLPPFGSYLIPGIRAFLFCFWSRYFPPPPPVVPETGLLFSFFIFLLKVPFVYSNAFTLFSVPFFHEPPHLELPFSPPLPRSAFESFPPHWVFIWFFFGFFVCPKAEESFVQNFLAFFPTSGLLTVTPLSPPLVGNTPPNVLPDS